MTTKKPGAKKGNKNAQKFESTPTPIMFKAPAEDIKKWQKKADQAGVSRSEWIRERLNGLTLHSASEAPNDWGGFLIFEKNVDGIFIVCFNDFTGSGWDRPLKDTYYWVSERDLLDLVG